MDGFFLTAVAALWLGVLTSISPCPLATNIVAISFIGRGVGSPGRVLLTGFFYTAGRTLTYVVLAVLVVASLLSIPHVANALQEHMNKVLGPILVLAGMVLLELIQVRPPGSGIGEKMRRRTEGYGVWGAGLLGMVFALSFCPVSAALFFGSLIPLSLKSGSSYVLPSLYGIGTALPVFAFAVVIALGTRWVSTVFNKLTQMEVWARRLTGAVFIAVGIYLSLVYIFGVFTA
jgi:cytochrome c biogenesis protein CcdA